MTAVDHADVVAVAVVVALLPEFSSAIVDDGGGRSPYNRPNIFSVLKSMCFLTQSPMDH